MDRSRISQDYARRPFDADGGPGLGCCVLRGELISADGENGGPRRGHTSGISAVWHLSCFSGLEVDVAGRMSGIGTGGS
jgi:hypothetical protein